MRVIPTAVAAALSLAITGTALWQLRQSVDDTNVLTAATVHYVLGGVTFLSTMFMPAPYGKHATDGYRALVLGPRTAWVLQELPTLVALTWNLATYAESWNAVSLLYATHYVHRTLIYPFWTLTTTNNVPVLVPFLANLYCSFNGHLQTLPTRNADDMTLWRAPFVFGLGVACFAGGMAINIWHDRHLASLRRTGAAGPGHYVIPRGGLFALVSSPNLMGEMVEWAGFSIAAWGVSCDAGYVAASFAVYTVANLLPRALATHRWYLAKFPEYKGLGRSAIIPFVL